jgi:hypothetical protein
MQQIKLINGTVINPLRGYFIHGNETFPAVLAINQFNAQNLLL